MALLVFAICVCEGLSRRLRCSLPLLKAKSTHIEGSVKHRLSGMITQYSATPQNFFLLFNYLSLYSFSCSAVHHLSFVVLLIHLHCVLTSVFIMSIFVQLKLTPSPFPSCPLHSTIPSLFEVPEILCIREMNFETNGLP